jgi:hypothetical protein
MRRFYVLCCVVALCCVVFPTAASAADEPSGPSISVPISTVAYGEEGSLHVLASTPVDAALQGSTCTVRAVADNNDSVHPDSTLTVASGSTSVRLDDVESAPGKVTDGSGTLVLGADLVVSVTLGPDGVFSGGIEVMLTCESPPPPTTAPPTTAPPTTTQPPPTTTQPPPTTTTTVPPDHPTTEVTVVVHPQPPVQPPATPVPAQPATAG